MGKNYINRGKVLRCAECGAEFLPWDEIYFRHDGAGEGLICEDCFDGIFEQLSRRERAELVGSAVLTAEELIGGRRGLR